MTDVDVLVAGAGGAGLAAALSAQQRGASVALLEWREHWRQGGNTAMSTSMVPAGGSRWQLDAGIDDSLQIPCEPRAVLKAICQQCHTRPLKNGAPFPLQRLSDVNSVHLGRLTRLDMIDDLNAGRMPLFPVTISATDKRTLLDWLNDGAPGVSPRSCLVEQEDAGSIEDAGDSG